MKIGEGLGVAGMWIGIALALPELNDYAGIAWLCVGALVVSVTALND